MRSAGHLSPAQSFSHPRQADIAIEQMSPGLLQAGEDAHASRLDAFLAEKPQDALRSTGSFQCL